MVMVVGEERTFGQDLFYYLPRWAAFGLVAAIVFGSAFQSPHMDPLLPEMSRMHTMLLRIPRGIGYGMLGGCIFVALQRVWNFDASVGKWWANILVAGIITTVVFLNISARHFHFGSHHDDALASQPDWQFTNHRATESQSGANERAAKKENAAMFAGTQSDAEKEQLALTIFYKFYFLNTTVRAGYCNFHGAVIPAFVSAFEFANKEARDLAQQGLRKYDDSEDHVYKEMATELYQYNASNLQDIAAHDHLTLKQECQDLQDHPQAQVSRLSFAKLQPEAMPFLRSAAR
jgi:hypothetical protein